MSIKFIGDLASTAFALRLALNKEDVPNRDNVVICLPLDEALAIHETCVAVSPGTDLIEFLVKVKSVRDFPEFQTFKMEKPGVPERTGEPWLAFFDIEVFVV